ncbi:tectonic-3-like [Babylonia areolata]|uniref:tectonic-3-like n=1 Tax=Babylonia areolata TaxID=304850 RepID=UPI003FD44661
MAVNMNGRECIQVVFGAFIVFLVILNLAVAATTTPQSVNTSSIAAGTTTVLTSNTTVSVPTSPTTTVTTTTTTTATTTAPVPLPEATVYDANSLKGVCPCDLTGNACDVNCCCDQTCTADDKLTFSQCLPFSVNVDNRLCAQNEITADDRLFCIYYDNKQERNYYTIPDIVPSLASFDNYRNEFHSFSFQSTPASSVNFDSSYYKDGDPIYTVFESEIIGVLGLPQMLTSECVDDNPAAYLSEAAHTCVRTMNNLTGCLPGAQGLDITQFIQGFRVVRSPRLFQELSVTIPGTDGFYSLYNNSLTLAVELDTTSAIDPVQCFDQGSGLTGPCNYSTSPLPTPSPGTKTCDKVVKKVHYRVITEGTSGIARVLVRVVLTNLTVPFASHVLFTQSFSATFEASGAASSFERSGNPGYMAGQPVLAGTLNQTSQVDTVSYQIFLSSSRDQYMTVVRASATGDCFTDSDSRMPVLFGQNVRTGCMLRVSASNLTQYCALMQQKIIETMEFESVPEIAVNGFRDTNRYVGLFGNSDASKTGDWVKVLYQNRPPTPSTDTSICRLSLGMHIQILYANIGALTNPQAKIIGVSFIYDSTKALQIRPTLTGEYNQPVEISMSVAFIDVSKPATRAEGEAPIFLAKIPYDFFYPFISGASVPKPLISAIFPLVLILYKVLL